MSPLLLSLLLAVPSAKPLKPVSLHAVTSKSVVIDFETAAPADAVVEVLCEGGVGGSARDTHSTHHTLSVGTLSANRQCKYQARVEREVLGSGAFWTAPPQGSGVPFGFAVVGDSRDHAKWAEVAHAIQGRRPRFVLTTGDASKRGDEVDAWRDYYAAAAELFASTPVFAAIGNHDQGSLFGPFDPAPHPGFGPSTYAFVYGNAGFIAFDSNRPEDADQRAFVDRALGAFTGGPLFVFQHHPLFSCGTHGSSSVLQQQYRALFERAHVAFDFAGHDHDLILWKPLGGVRYAVSGGGGANPYGLSGCEGPFARQGYGFLWVNVDGAKINATFYDEHGVELYAAEPIQAPKPSVPLVDLDRLLSAHDAGE